MTWADKIVTLQVRVSRPDFEFTDFAQFEYIKDMRKVSQKRQEKADHTEYTKGEIACGAVPDEPGCYAWADSQTGEYLYIGKAVRLRSRIRSYVSDPIQYRRPVPPEHRQYITVYEKEPLYPRNAPVEDRQFTTVVNWWRMEGYHPLLRVWLCPRPLNTLMELVLIYLLQPKENIQEKDIRAFGQGVLKVCDVCPDGAMDSQDTSDHK